MYQNFGQEIRNITEVKYNKYENTKVYEWSDYRRQNMNLVQVE